MVAADAGTDTDGYEDDGRGRRAGGRPAHRGPPSDDVATARRRRLRRRLIALGGGARRGPGAGGAHPSPRLDVDEITVTGAERSDPAALVTASGIAPGSLLIGLDLDRAVAGVRAQPWVLDATVDRTWSGQIAIAVVERTPVATIDAGAGGWLLVDGDRRIVATSTAPPDLPVLTGVGPGAVGAELAPEAQGAIDVAGALTPGCAPGWPPSAATAPMASSSCCSPPARCSSVPPPSSTPACARSRRCSPRST